MLILNEEMIAEEGNHTLIYGIFFHFFVITTYFEIYKKVYSAGKKVLSFFGQC